MARLKSITLSGETVNELAKTHSRKELAEMFNCSEKTVSRFCKEHNIEFNKTKRRTLDMSQWYESIEVFPDTIKELVKMSVFSYENIKVFLDKQKVSDLAKASIIMGWIKEHPDHLWENRGHIFKTRNIKNFKIAHNRINRELTIILTLHDKSKIIHNYKNVDEFKNQFPIPI